MGLSNPSLPQAVCRPDRIGSGGQALAALLWLPQAALIAWAVQGLLDARSMTGVYWAAAGVLGLGVARALADALGGRRLYRAARRQVSALRARAVWALACRSPLDITRAPSGQAASILTEQAEAALPYLTRYLAVRQRVALLPWIIAAVVAWHSWVAALALLLTAPLIPVFMALVGWRAKAASQAHLSAMGSLNAFLLDRLRGLASLRALGALACTAERLASAAESLRVRTMRVLRIAFLSSAVLEFFSALGVALVAIYIGFHLLGYLSFGAWGQKLSLQQGLFVLLLAPAFFEPLRELASVWHDRAAGVAALEALQELTRCGVAMPAAQPDPERSLALSASQAQYAAHRISGTVCLRKLTLHAPNSTTPVLENLSLDIADGEHVALTGASGSGKSLLLAAVAGLLPVQHGQVLVCGQHAADNADRRVIAWVGQRPHVFAGTVRANVTLGRTDIDHTAVVDALALARLDEVEQAHAGQVLGEGGQGLSGGEAARLALARIAADARVRVILADEPTAHLDSQTAREVRQALLALAQERTLLVATHDPALIALMHRQLAVGAPRVGFASSAQPASKGLKALRPIALAQERI